jgi:hypothetical protein
MRRTAPLQHRIGSQRRGLSLPSFLILVLLTAGAVYLAWVWFTGSGGALWEAQRHRDALQGAEQAVDYGLARSQRWLDEARRPGGLAEQAEAWLSGRRSSSTSAASNRTPIAAANPLAVSGDHRNGLRRADAAFLLGHERWRRVSALEPTAAPALAAEAADAFATCRDLLAIHLPAYAAQPDADPRLLAEMRALEPLNARLLAHAQAAAGKP